MESWQVGCDSCRMTWFRVGTCSEYERQAIESRPCPGCGAYTLACSPPRPAGRRRGKPLSIGVPATGRRRAG